MSLFSSLQLASNALQAQQIGMHVVGNNIANANTPGYARQTLNLVPAPPQQLGDLKLGLGVKVQGITQQIDRFLENRMRTSGSDVAFGDAQESAYTQLETIVGELSDTDLSTALTTFFGSINDILNQPNSVSVRNLAVLQGSTLAGEIRNLDQRVRNLQSNVNEEVVTAAGNINTLLKTIAELNVQITASEGGGLSGSDAVGLRDARGEALKALSQLIDIRSSEQESGDVIVYSGGEYLVFTGQYREVKVERVPDDGLLRAEVRFEDTDSQLSINSGRIAGLVSARDSVLGGYLTRLNDFTKTFAFEFNKVYSGGQGLTGYSSVQSEFAIDDPALTLDNAGLKYAPANGTLKVLVLNKQTGLTSTTEIKVDLNGLDDDDTAASFIQKLNAITGITASLDDTRHLRIAADSPTVSFGFADDTSGILAAWGVNTFFSGSSAGDLGVSSVLKADPGKFAASRGGIAEDSNNGETLAALLTSPLESQNGESLSVLYDRFTSELAQGAAVAKAVSQGNKDFYNTLEGQQLAISGVNIDEEVVRMIAYQRAFQANARFVSALNELFDVLVNL